MEKNGVFRVILGIIFPKNGKLVLLIENQLFSASFIAKTNLTSL